MIRVKQIKNLFILFTLSFITLMAFNIWVESGSLKKEKKMDQLMIENEVDFEKSKTDTKPSKESVERTERMNKEKNGWKNSKLLVHNRLKVSPDSNDYWMQKLNIEERPWFMENGTLRPNGRDPLFTEMPIWPDESDPNDDRIINQLMYVPPNYNPLTLEKEKKLKKILLYFDRGGWRDLPLGRTKFLSDNCPVNTCSLTTSHKDIETADAIFFKVILF